MKSNSWRYNSLLNNKLNYFLVLIFIYISSIEFYNLQNKILLVSCFLLSSLLFIIKKIRIGKLFLVLIFLLTITIIFQTFTFQFISIPTTLSTYIKYIYAYTVVKIVKQKLSVIFVKIMYILTILSLALYIPSLISNDFFNNLTQLALNLKIDPDNPFHLIFYNVEISTYNNILRNSGPMWEPGAFAGFLIIATIFNYLKNKAIFDKYNIVFFIGIISTISTAGYITLFFTLIAFLLTSKLKFWYKLLFIPLLIYAGIYLYNNLSFLNNKIELQLEVAEKGSNKGRFGSALVDLNDIKEYPLFGRGRNISTRYNIIEASSDWNFNHRTNGITDFIVKNGIIFFLLFLVLLYKSSKAISQYYKVHFEWYFIIIVIILTFSQGYLERPFFISLVFLYSSYTYINNKKLIINKTNEKLFTSNYYY